MAERILRAAGATIGSIDDKLFGLAIVNDRVRKSPDLRGLSS
jgi:hypothetical protein